MLSASSDVALKLGRLPKTNHYNRELHGFGSIANLLILGWVEGFEPSATGTTMQTRMHSVCTQASETCLSGPCD